MDEIKVKYSSSGLTVWFSTESDEYGRGRVEVEFETEQRRSATLRLLGGAKMYPRKAPFRHLIRAAFDYAIGYSSRSVRVNAFVDQNDRVAIKAFESDLGFQVATHLVVAGTPMIEFAYWYNPNLPSRVDVRHFPQQNTTVLRLMSGEQELATAYLRFKNNDTSAELSFDAGETISSDDFAILMRDVFHIAQASRIRQITSVTLSASFPGARDMEAHGFHLLSAATGDAARVAPTFTFAWYSPTL